MCEDWEKFKGYLTSKDLKTMYCFPFEMHAFLKFSSKSDIFNISTDVLVSPKVNKINSHMWLSRSKTDHIFISIISFQNQHNIK